VVSTDDLHLYTPSPCPSLSPPLALQENEAWSALLSEISSEAGEVAQFLLDREIEAPERYSAVQSYRVAMAVLRQQRLFVEVRGVRRIFYSSSSSSSSGGDCCCHCFWGIAVRM